MFRNKSPAKASTTTATVTVSNPTSAPFPPSSLLSPTSSSLPPPASSSSSSSAGIDSSSGNSRSIVQPAPFSSSTSPNSINTTNTVRSAGEKQQNNNHNNNNNANIQSSATLKCSPIVAVNNSDNIINNSSSSRSHLLPSSHSVITSASSQPSSIVVSGTPGNGTPSSSGSSSIASPSTIARRPTHRRGLSHGSFSLLNTSGQQATSGPNSGNSSKANTLTLGVPASAIHSAHLYSHSHTMHYSGSTSGTSGLKANSSEFLSHGDNLNSNNNDNDQTLTSGLHGNPSGTSLASSHASGSIPQSEDIRRALAHIDVKIRKTKDQIKEEQLRCDDNVNEYLKLSANAEPNQSSRIKTLFENNNKKSTQKITRLQKKLKQYDEKMREIKDTGVYSRHTREKLKDGVNIITGISGGVIEGIKSGIHSAGETVIAKPKEFFKRSTNDSSNADPSGDSNGGYPGDSSAYSDLHQHSLHHTLDRDATLSPASIPGGSVASAQGLTSGQQNLNHSGGALNSANSHSTKCTSDDESSTSITSGSGQVASGGNHSFNNSAHLSSSPLKMKPLMSRTSQGKIVGSGSESNFESAVSGELEALRHKLDDRNEDCIRMASDLNNLKGQYQNDVVLLNQLLQDEKYRVDRLEEQLIDLTELHQREIENLRQTITDLEEKMLYQTEERHRDVHEMLESFQTRISRMEHQQHQHLQQLVNLDSLENSNARALVLKLINVLLTVLQVVLLLVATLANILSPFLHTRARIFTSVIVILFFSFVFQHWPELTIWTKQKIYEKCLYILSRLPFLSFDDPNST